MLPKADLWDRYREHTELINGAAIIQDGIVDKDKWEKAPRKVLILLKDPHEEDPSKEWNLADTIRVGDWAKNASTKIWNTAGQMAFAIQNWGRDSFPQLKIETSEDRTKSKDLAHEALLATAVVNIKKTGGSSAAKDEEISSWAEKTKDLLLEQIRDIGPDIVLCGGTWQYIKDYWDDNKKVARPVYHPDKFYYIDYYHPANRYPNLLNYYALGGIMMSSGLVGKVPKR